MVTTYAGSKEKLEMPLSNGHQGIIIACNSFFFLFFFYNFSHMSKNTGICNAKNVMPKVIFSKIEQVEK